MVTASRAFPWPAPFVATSILAYALLALTPSVDVTWVGVAVLVNVALLAGIWLVPWQRLHPSALATPALLFLLVVGCLREAAGTTSGYTPLILLPIVWLGLHSRMAEVVVASLAAGLVVLLPAAFDQGVDGNVVRATILFVALSLVVGFAIRRQVLATAASTAKLQKLQALHLNDAVVQQLTRAQLALEIGDVEQAQQAIGVAVTGAKQIVTTIIRSSEIEIAPGRFRTDA